MHAHKFERYQKRERFFLRETNSPCSRFCIHSHLTTMSKKIQWVQVRPIDLYFDFEEVVSILQGEPIFGVLPEIDTEEDTPECRQSALESPVVAAPEAVDSEAADACENSPSCPNYSEFTRISAEHSSSNVEDDTPENGPCWNADHDLNLLDGKCDDSFWSRRRGSPFLHPLSISPSEELEIDVELPPGVRASRKYYVSLEIY
jgi:hypothetical protein